MILKMEVIGYIGQDAKVIETAKNKMIVFSVAYNDTWTDNQGTKHENTTWVNCKYFKKEGQSLELVKYLTKGTQVFVEGTPEARPYVANNEAAASLECNARTIKLLGSK